MLLASFWSAKFAPEEFPNEYKQMIATLVERCHDIETDNLLGMTPRALDLDTLDIPEDIRLLAEWPTEGRMGADFNTAALDIIKQATTSFSSRRDLPRLAKDLLFPSPPSTS